MLIRCFEPHYVAVRSSETRKREFVKSETKESMQIEFELEQRLIIKFTAVNNGIKRSPVNLFIPSICTDSTKSSSLQRQWYDWIFDYSSKMIALNKLAVDVRTTTLLSMIGANLICQIESFSGLPKTSEIILCGKYINIPTQTKNEYYSSEMPRLTDLRNERKRKNWDPFNMKFKKEMYIL